MAWTCAMLWITFALIALASAGVRRSQGAASEPAKRYTFNELIIRYDHCREPQVLNRETWTCECPAPLRKVGDECVCDGCLFTAMEGSYAEKRSDLPEYLTGFLRQLDEEELEEVRAEAAAAADEGSASSRMLPKSDSKKSNEIRSQARRKLKKYMKYVKLIADKVKTHCEDSDAVTSRRFIPRVIIQKNTNFVHFVKDLRLIPHKNKPGRSNIRLKKVDWDRARILNPKKVEGEGKSFSDTSVAGHTKGIIHSGEDRAFGALSNFFGTGSVSLAADQGAAAAVAHTGEGISVSGIKSRGATALGVGLIGKKAFRGSSTTTMLIGEGDAIATNSRSKTGSASATAVATKKVATAGSAAHGAAAASAAATPGRGSAIGAATYGDDLRVSSSVSGKRGPVAESSAVGDPGDDLQDLLRQKGEPPPNPLKALLARDRSGDSSFDMFAPDSQSSSDWLED